jgi:hypothetical protein
MYRLSSSSSPSIRTLDELNEETLAGKAHIAKLKQLTESEVTEWTSSTVSETAVPILTRQGSRGITIVRSHSQIIFNSHVIPY